MNYLPRSAFVAFCLPFHNNVQAFLGWASPNPKDLKNNKTALMALDRSPESISAQNEFELIFGLIEQKL